MQVVCAFIGPDGTQSPDATAAEVLSGRAEGVTSEGLERLAIRYTEVLLSQTFPGATVTIRGKRKAAERAVR